jgi:hypothetical protein
MLIQKIKKQNFFAGIEDNITGKSYNVIMLKY